MSDQAVLSVRVIADTGNAVPQILRVEQQLQRADAQSRRTAETLGGPLAQASQRAAASSLALAQAEARLLAASGNLTGAEQRLQTALVGTEAALTQQYSAQRQLLGLQQQAERQVAQGAVAIQRQANESLALAQAEARLLATTGDLAAAESRLANALTNSTASLRQQIAAHTQLAAVRSRIATTSATEQAGTNRLSSGLDALSSRYDQLGSAAGALGVGIGVDVLISTGQELSAVGAQAETTAQRFDQLAASSGTTGQALLGALRAASGNEINDLNLQLAANRAQLLEVADSAEDFSVLLAIARDRAQFLGQDTGKAFDDLVTGLGRGSAEILDNLGIMISVEEVNKNYAASVGKTVDALTAAERRTALINAVLAQGKASLEANGGAAEVSASKFDRMGASLDNLKAKMGQGLNQNILAPAATGATPILDALGGNTDTNQFAGLLTAIEETRRQLAGLPPLTQAQSAQFNAMAQSGTAAFQSIASNIGAYAVAAENTRRALAGLPEMTAQQADQFLVLMGVQQQAGASSVQLANATQVSTQATQINTQAAIANAPAIVQEAFAREQATRAALDSAAASAEDTAQKELQTLMQQRANAEVSNAVAEFLRLNPTISASAAASAAAAAGYSPQIARLVELAVRARAARAEIAALNALAGVKNLNPSSAGAAVDDVQSFKRSVQRDQTNALIASQRAAEAAQRDLAASQGNYQPQVDQYNRDLAAINNRLGDLVPGTVAYNQALAEQARAQQRLNQAEASAGRAKGGGGGGAGGGAAKAPKLTDQQKLNNQLQADEERYQSRVEDSYAEHQRKLSDIAKEYADKRRQAAEDAHLAELGSQASFYRRTGDLQDQAIREQASREFEQARQDAAKLDADVRDDYLKEREQQIAGRAERAQEIADQEREAREASSKAERDQAASRAEYLRGVDQLERQLEDERLRRIQESRDTLAAQEEAASSAETERYTRQQDQLAEQAGRSADRRVLAAQRAGKAVDAERTAVEELAQSYAKIPGGAGGAAPETAGTATPPQTASAAPAAAATANPLDTVAGLLRELIDAVRESGRQVVGAERDTASKIGALAGALR